MTRAAGPLGRFVGYDQERLVVSSGGRPASGPNAALLIRRVAWADVQPDQREPAAAALREEAAVNMLPRGLLQAAQQRRAAAVARLVARGTTCHELRVRPVWRLAVGLGEETPSETGLRLHGTYGVPVLPGSALKGTARAHARDRQPDDADSDYETGAEDYAGYGSATFGNEPGDTGHAAAGAVVFLDALPEALRSPRGAVAVDVVNPHVSGYYRTGGQTPPAEYLQPVPVQFLAVTAEVAFRVHVLGRGPDADTAEIAADQACGWLRAALAKRGLGAKTNAGYGYFDVEVVQPARAGEQATGR